VLGVLLNVASNSGHLNGRGRIFPDGSFEYLPIPEDQPTRVTVPTYRSLGYPHVKYPDLPVHLDPEFTSCTYGHITRGFGDISSLLRLGHEDTLFFYATLQSREGWATYMIGYFQQLTIIDCRHKGYDDVLSLRERGFHNNAHLKRENPEVDLLIHGGAGSKRLSRAFPLSRAATPRSLDPSLTNLLFTSTGKTVQSGSPWFRWTLTCPQTEILLAKIQAN
jgi:hypothetical protein